MDAAFHRLEEMTWRDLESLPRDETLVVVPISPLEEHGPHLPLGVDLFDAEAFGLETARVLAGRRPGLHVVLYPRVPLGSDTFSYLGSIEIRPGAIRDVATDIGLSLGREGFRHILFMNGHGGPCHNVALDEACTRLWRRGIRAIAPFGELVERLFLGKLDGRIREGLTAAGVPGLQIPLHQDLHAGAFETSLMLHLRPELVTEERAKLAPVVVPVFKVRPDTALTAGEGLGYLGAPAEGSAELGKVLLELLGAELADVCEALMNGDDVRSRARCRLYWVPIFWSRRRPMAFASAAAVAALLLLWLS